MRKIKLYGWLKGKRIVKAVALVDDEDFDVINSYSWHLHSKGYAARKVKVSEKSTLKVDIVKLHQQVLNFPSSGIDHRDGNGLNCQKDNLRLATQQENSRNKSKRSNCSSKYKGVHWDKGIKAWRVNIKVGTRKFYIGSSTDENRAGELYNEAAIECFGEFAKLNIIKYEKERSK